MFKKEFVLRKVKEWQEQVDKYNNPQWVKEHIENCKKYYEKKIAYAKEQLKDKNREWFELNLK